MKKEHLKSKSIVFIVMLGMLFSSCTKLMYVPNAQNVPTIREKHDAEVSIAIRNFQAAYAITDNIGVAANLLYSGNPESTTGGYKVINNRVNVEGALGYYDFISDILNFHVYGGGGWVKYSQEGYELNGPDEILDYEFHSSAMKYYLQPAIGISNEYIDLFFSNRFVGLKFHSINTEYHLAPVTDESINANMNSIYGFAEPSITFRVGYKWMKFHMQYMRSFLLTGEELNRMEWAINIGLRFYINPRLFN